MTNAAETTAKNSAPAEPGAPVAPETAASNKNASRKKNTPKVRKTAKHGKAKTAAPKARGSKHSQTAEKAAQAERPAKPTTSRPQSKGARLLTLIARPQGATLAELMQELGWQAHSVRGFISTAGKKTPIHSSKNDAGERVYKAAQ
jgi:hypothetical protein